MRRWHEELLLLDHFPEIKDAMIAAD